MAEIGIIWADDASLIAVYNYVQRQRPYINEYPGLLELITDFEVWYQGLSWFDVHIMINDTLAEAYRRRDEINKLMGQRLPDDQVPADKWNAEPGAASGLPGQKPPPPPFFPSWTKPAAALLAVGITTVAVLRKVRII